MGNYQASPRSIKTLNQVKEGGFVQNRKNKEKRRKKEEEEEKKKGEEPLAGAPPPATLETTGMKLGVPPTNPSREPSPEQPLIAGKPPKRSLPELRRSHRAVDFPTSVQPTQDASSRATTLIAFSSLPRRKPSHAPTSEKVAVAGKQPKRSRRKSAAAKPHRLLSQRPADRSHLQPRRRLQSITLLVG